MATDLRHVAWLALRLSVMLLAIVLSCAPRSARAGTTPLLPLDTSSPRATLQGFVDDTDTIYTGIATMLEGYMHSDRLYLDADERAQQAALLGIARKALRALDLSHISPVLSDTVPIERMLQLREILDRISLPAFTDIPDGAAMAKAGAKRWRIPGTEIDLVLMPDGSRAGEYLISADTVDRLPDFYDRIRDLPYKPGPAQRLSEVYRTLSGGRVMTIYGAYLASPAGLNIVIPPRWMLTLPRWAKAQIASVTVWQWVGLGLGGALCALLLLATHRLARRIGDRQIDDTGPHWSHLPLPLVVMLVAAVLVPALCLILRVGGGTRMAIAITATVVSYLGAAWFAVIALTILGELIVASEHLRPGTLDNQLIRLTTRLLGGAFALAALIRGADELGFPAYSVIAGLGVGGLAVALAARDSLANLLGSLFIMFEKPFRIGHMVRIAGMEGTVEDVGFRSTRIRTWENSLVSLPNNTVVNTAVENLSLRPMRRQRFFLQVTYDTPREKVEALTDAVRQVILDYPLTHKTNLHVRFHGFGESSLDILVIFHLDVPDLGAELREREAVLLRVMDAAAACEVAFAFPTRTLRIESDAAPPLRPPA